MIGKVTQGAGAGGFLKYDTQKDGAEILFKNNLYGENAEEWANEMRAVADQRNVKNDTIHISFSLDKERATNEQWEIVAKAALESLGFEIDKTQFLLTRHSDTKRDHVHLVVNRIMLNGKIASDSNIRYRTHEATRAAELAAGLTQFQKSAEIGRSGKMVELRSTIKSALSSSNSYTNFKSNLQKSGIELIENRSKNTGYVSGISYKIIDTQQTWKGSAIGKEYSYNAIIKSFENESQLSKTSESSKNEASKSPQKSGAAKQAQSHDANTAGAATQARADAERSKKDTHTSKARQSSSEDENKRLAAIKQAQQQDEDEM